MNSYNDNLKKFTYFSIENLPNDNQENPNHEISREQLEKILQIFGKEILKDETLSLEGIVQKIINESQAEDGSDQNQVNKKEQTRTNPITNKLLPTNPMSIIVKLEKSGYLKDSPKWLSKKGFFAVGGKLLQEVMKALNKSNFGLHETAYVGNGSLNLETTRKYEHGDDLKSINVSKSLMNAIERISRKNREITVPIDFLLEDLEQYETKQEVSVAVVYCIYLSSTMRYSTMYGQVSRIEAAKKALWSLFLLNQKFFTTDSVHIIGFGALASKISPYDIPYLKTFDPGTDFLHYTNYQAAFRLARKILQKEGTTNKRVVMITDGHPSACFIDDVNERDKILAQRPYSQFYIPDKETLSQVKKKQYLELDTNSGKMVYLCYRYRQVDQYIGEKTIMEAKKCQKSGIGIDTIMISEEDSLLEYVNEMEKIVKGRSYYINPYNINKILISDYLNNKKKILESS